MSAQCPGVYNEDKRIAQLIQRDERTGADLIVLDILGTEHEGAQGISFGSGMKGLHHLAFTKPREKSAFGEGAVVSPFPRVDERLPELTLVTVGRTLAIREAIDSLLWRVAHRKKTCYLRVFDATGTRWRELQITLSESVDDQTDYLIGSLNLSHSWTVKFVAAEQPYWVGPVIEHTLIRGRDMTLQSDGRYLGFMPVENPSDNDAWIEWASGTITTTEQWWLPDADAVYTAKNAPTPAQVGANIMHDLPALGPGKEFLVQTYPSAPTLMVRDGALDWARMRGQSFDYPLEPETPWRRTVPVYLKGGTAQSTISVFITPRWDRPYGGEVS